jgi:hypothetical protein
VSKKSYRQKVRQIAVLTTEVAPGERLVPFYSWDFATCACPPSKMYGSIPCLPVAVQAATGTAAGGRARCMACDLSFRIPEARRADRMTGGVR